MIILIDGVAPVFSIIALGYLLRRIGMTDEKFLSISDRLVYFIFFPSMLFWKIGKPATPDGFDWDLILAAGSAVFLVFLLSLALVKLFRIDNYEVGSFCQGCFRFNTYIGMAIILAALGEDGVRTFGVLVGLIIPFINVLAVSTLIWFSGKPNQLKTNALIFAKATITNPLIIACGSGMLYSALNAPFPRSVDSTLSLMSLLALPLALISIGGSLTLAGFKEDLKPALISTAVKLLCLPAIGYYLLTLFNVAGISFKTAMIFFALPTSTANYILSSQLNSNVNLAGATVVVSTLLCVLSLSVILIIFCR